MSRCTKCMIYPANTASSWCQNCINTSQMTSVLGGIPDNLPGVALKYDAGKPDFSLHPPAALEEIAKVWTFGEKKYAAHNWCKGFTWRRPTAAALRHIFSWLAGEDADPESGLSHLAHACCCLMMLLHFVKHETGEDNRYKETSK